MRKKKEKTEGVSKKKGGKLSKKLLVLLVLILAAAVLAGYTFMNRGTERRLGSDGADASASSSADSSAGDSSAADSSAGDSSEAEPPAQPETLKKTETTKTVPETVNYLRSLSPSALGLEGNSMEGYEIIPKGNVVFVDGRQCTEVFVYEVDEDTGTNCFLGSYLLDRGEGGQLYSLDQDSGVVTQINLAGTVNGG